MRKLILLAAAFALSVPVGAVVFPAVVAHAESGCGTGYYRNSRGNCVPRPVRADRPPAGASAQCRDGTYSFSQSRSGTCSHHGGVARWL
jgi:hypothetical protein